MLKLQIKEIKNKFKYQIELIVDNPKPSYGNSNDGNRAKRFFKNADVSSSIIRVNTVIVKRFVTILKTIANGYNINLELF